MRGARPNEASSVAAAEPGLTSPLTELFVVLLYVGWLTVRFAYFIERDALLPSTGTARMPHLTRRLSPSPPLFGH